MAEVQLHEGESLESALKRFKRKVLQEDIIKEIKRHAFYFSRARRSALRQLWLASAAAKSARETQRTVSEPPCSILRTIPSVAGARITCSSVLEV